MRCNAATFRFMHVRCCWFQDSIDLFLGNFAVDESDGPTPLRVQKDWKFLTVSISAPCPVVTSSRTL